jgi:hypothetical protein
MSGEKPYVIEEASVPTRGFIKSYDDTPCGRGHVVFTPHVEKALRFESAGAAMEFWRTRSKTVPTRPDGKPNRPLTAFTVEIRRA